MKDLIFDFLSSLPSKRESLSFISKHGLSLKDSCRNRPFALTYVPLLSSQDSVDTADLAITSKCISTIHQLGLRPVVYFGERVAQKTLMKIMNSIDALGCMSIPLRVGLNDGPHNARHILTSLRMDRIPIILPYADAPSPSESSTPLPAIIDQLSPVLAISKLIVLTNSPLTQTFINLRSVESEKLLPPSINHEIFTILRGASSSTSALIFNIHHELSNLISGLVREKGSTLHSAAEHAVLSLTDSNANFQLSFSAVPEQPSTTAVSIVRFGASISVISQFSDIDLMKLNRLLESSFKKKLKSDALLHLKQTPFKLFVVGDYKGASLLWPIPGTESMYLDKFAISPDGQGLGVADSLWSLIVQEFPKILAWRSRASNPVNRW